MSERNLQHIPEIWLPAQHIICLAHGLEKKLCFWRGQMSASYYLRFNEVTHILQSKL
jgi:hypothetical protein